MSMEGSGGGWEEEVVSLLRRTERRAWVPQAFWMTWAAKKRVEEAEWSNVPS